MLAKNLKGRLFWVKRKVRLMLSKEKFSYYNQQGLIPAPQESQEDFIRRAEFCLNLKEELSTHLDVVPPFIDAACSKEILNDAAIITEPLYGIAPSWVPVSFSNQQLKPWHGGCAWIFQLSENSPLASFLQLRTTFSTQNRLLGIYERSELIAHELSHVGRMAYQEPIFEEFFAYQSSDSWLRRRCGPIIQTPQESLFFILLLALVLIANLALPTNMSGSALFWLWGINMTPFLLVFAALARLTLRQRQLTLARKNLYKLLLNETKTQHLLYRLTDGEIRLFAKLPPDRIRAFIAEQAINSFRWQFLTHLTQI